MLGSPIIRPLLELELNGCTNFEAARVLMADELVLPVKFKSRAQGSHGMTCEGIELTNFGLSTLFQNQEGLDGNPWWELFRNAILGYACIDRGSGICGTRSRIESALELPDADILRRLVFIGNGERQLHLAVCGSKMIDSTLRASTASWWSHEADARRSGQIIDFSLS
jgi:hypothetical protein